MLHMKPVPIGSAIECHFYLYEQHDPIFNPFVAATSYPEIVLDSHAKARRFNIHKPSLIEWKVVSPEGERMVIKRVEPFPHQRCYFHRKHRTLPMLVMNRFVVSDRYQNRGDILESSIWNVLTYRIRSYPHPINWYLLVDQLDSSVYETIDFLREFSTRGPRFLSVVGQLDSNSRGQNEE